MRMTAILVVCGVLAGTGSSALGQEQKRPERMEGALGPAEDTRSSSSTPVAEGAHPTLPGLQRSGMTVLHNQWSLSPAGSHVQTGDFPVNIAMHPGGEYAAVLHCGNGTHEVVVLRLKDRGIVAKVTIPEGFYGVCFSPDGSVLYASGGEYDVVHRWSFGADGLLSQHETVKIVDAKESFVVGGLAMSGDGSRLYVCGPWGGKLAIVGSAPGAVGESEPGMVDIGKDTYPYAVLPGGGGKLYVTMWGGAGVAVVDPEAMRVEARWETPSHPTEMALSPKGDLLYVACSNANAVAVLDTASGKTTEVITTSLYPKAPNGSTPTSLALTADGSVLLVANADNNNLAVFNVSERGKARSIGFIPTGWHPTSVRLDAKGNIVVADGKGLNARSNRNGPQPGEPAHTIREYIGSLMVGAVSTIKFPTPAELAAYTSRAYACSPLREDSGVAVQERGAGNPIPEKLGDDSPIKHCIYIIKENRTYDQVFGDMKEGNGDASLCLFPEQVTPNLHALAREFVLLDNFYVESEVSADGHEWSMAAYATDFVERTWPINYRKQPKNAEIQYPSEGAYDIAVPAGGYIWDRCAEAGVSYRSYGEWVANGKTARDPCRAKVKAIEGHFDPMYRSFDTGYSDLDRAARFIEELGRFEKDDAGMPRFVIVRLPNDHTAGTKVGALTPTALVAQNDLAVGRVVEAISRSRFWKDTAIFVVEDDAQNGPDHVDAHRTTALVISPWTKRHVVDSSLYSTSSMLRTMELILGLKPMSQFDAAARPMYASFADKPDVSPFEARPARVDLEARNVATAWGAETSAEMDLAVEDAADDLLLNEIVWKSVRGAESPMPAPVRAAFVFASGKRGAGRDGDDDDDRAGRRGEVGGREDPD